MLACRKKGLTLADARCPSFLFQNELEWKQFYIGDGPYTGDHTKLFGSMDWNRDEDIDVGVREGYVSIGVEGL